MLGAASAGLGSTQVATPMELQQSRESKDDVHHGCAEVSASYTLSYMACIGWTWVIYQHIQTQLLDRLLNSTNFSDRSHPSTPWSVLMQTKAKTRCGKTGIPCSMLLLWTDARISAESRHSDTSLGG